MKTVVSVLSVAALAGLGLVACTPKPDLPQPVVQEFLDAVAAKDFQAAAELTDSRSAALADLTASYEGLQADGFSGEVDKATISGDNATAEYSMKWSFPRQRVWDYDNSMMLSRTPKGWVIRWQPSVLYPGLGANQHMELRAITPPKAGVLSADGAEILAPGTYYRILIDPAATNSAAVRAAAARIATAIQQVHAADDRVGLVDAKKLMDQANGASYPISVAMLTEAQYLPIKEQLQDFPGIRVNPEAGMINTDPSFAPEIMSRVENIVHDEVEGAKGWQVIAANNNGAQLEVLTRHDPQPAPAIRVSLDKNVQDAAQKAVDLRREMKAMMVVIKPSTGDIMAVAQTPAADGDGDVAMSGQYPPGSTFKMITATAGVEHQDLSNQSIVPCPGTMDIGHRIVTNYNGFSKGNVPLQSAFAASCNTTFADISSKLEPGQLQATAKQFGVGLDYDIPGINSMTGSVPQGEELVDRTEAGFGQGKDLASPFGMALAAATAAAGHTPTPTLISGHTTTVSEKVDPPSAHAIEELRAMMRAVVTSGTARGMQAQGEIFGKTGEAEISGGSHAWFVGYRGDMAFATLIVLGGGSESAVAITDHFLRTLDENTTPVE
ncbi:penicillin-binding transpeptidase domain-containing protein [Corynebacterium aquilae]|uniref:Cell division protein FtsI n=1 Tax=Corynebacterium aquilae DSM 44791 TaxID=1431546 RepID=A0A1L7CGK0_9CORY|nr:penicillin-binding transpeptidase domain-containing protein [Corynebacterium aquilae]APT84990.1 cell division protein FtsI [Corynebacterium aquilae DSM 44791]